MDPEGIQMGEYPDYFDDTEEESGCVRLSRVTYELADGQPDAMGWRAVDVEGVSFGTICDMLADANTGQILFVAITSRDTGKTSLVPVEGSYLDLVQRVLIIPARESEIRGCPDFTDDIVDLMPFVDYWMKLAQA
jgi:hypothetical protein